MVGIFNAAIFNNSIFNTGTTTTSGHSGWYRIALAAWQKDSLKKYYAAQPKPEQPEPFKESVVVKENKDGSVTVKDIEVERKKKRKKWEAEERSIGVPDFKPTPMYMAPTLPNYGVLANDILGDLPEIKRAFESRVIYQKAANDEEEDLLTLLLAA